MEVEEHYKQLLRLDSTWRISDIELQLSQNKIVIWVEYLERMAACPKCQQVTPVHDRRSSRTWRHLNIMQFETHLSCRIPRIKCPEHGILSIPVPWADIRSRFTLLFEGFAVELLEIARSVEEARKLLGVNWHQLEDIKRKAVARGLKRRSNAAIPYLGIDEKQFKGTSKNSLLMPDKGIFCGS